MSTLMHYLKPEIVWFIVGAILLMIEYLAPAMVSLFFGIGAVIVSFVCLFASVPLVVQLTIFLATSLLSLVILRKRFRDTFSGGVSDFDQAIMKIVGQKVRVIESISANNPGKVDLNGVPWTAESNASIEVGEFVEITERNGLVLKVKPMERKE
jgi:inner membrane protein